MREYRGLSINFYTPEPMKEQLRCNDAYANWIDFMLYGQESQTMYDFRSHYTFKIVDSPQEMECKLKKHMEEGMDSGNVKNNARMVAGYCWEWSNPDPNPSATLPKDVKITSRVGLWEKPWNRKPIEMIDKAERSKHPTKVEKKDHPYTRWYEEVESFEQLGCVYTVQGFDMDYIGVIFARDLYIGPTGAWRYNLSVSRDDQLMKGIKKSLLQPQHILNLFKNIYRILLTRGKKGCYVYFEDENTKKYFEQELEKLHQHKPVQVSHEY
jgi:hypothetical protein